MEGISEKRTCSPQATQQRLTCARTLLEEQIWKEKKEQKKNMFWVLSPVCCTPICMYVC